MGFLCHNPLRATMSCTVNFDGKRVCMDVPISHVLGDIIAVGPHRVRIMAIDDGVYTCERVETRFTFPRVGVEGHPARFWCEEQAQRFPDRFPLKSLERFFRENGVPDAQTAVARVEGLRDHEGWMGPFDITVDEENVMAVEYVPSPRLKPIDPEYCRLCWTETSARCVHGKPCYSFVVDTPFLCQTTSLCEQTACYSPIPL